MKILTLFMLIGVVQMQRLRNAEEPKKPRVRKTPTGQGGKADWAFCTKDKPCGAKQGDCDSNDQCAAGLICGINNCRNFHKNAHRLADCCEPVEEPAGRCVVDSPLRLLTHYVNLGADATPETCIEACLDLKKPGPDPKEKGYIYAGVQAGNQCFCGNSNISSTYDAPNSECNSRCSGDSNQICGGVWRMNVYETGIPWPSPDAPPPKPPGQQARSCGQKNKKRIVGGKETGKNEYPWQVGIVNPSGGHPFCGGAIISGKTILTAAHCVEGSSKNDFKVVIGEHDTTKNDGEEIVDVCNIKMHPNYDSDTVENDFAVLTLCKPLTWTDEVSPVCLPGQSGSSYDSVLTSVTGWGSLSTGGAVSNVLMGVDVNTESNAICNGKYGDGYIADSMICATAPGKDACQGDSGGPMVTDEGGKFHSIIGVVSWGFDCADPNFPGVYARVTKAKQWIESNMEGERLPSSRSRSRGGRPRRRG